METKKYAVCFGVYFFVCLFLFVCLGFFFGGGNNDLIEKSFDYSRINNQTRMSPVTEVRHHSPE